MPTGITSARYTMQATVLHGSASTNEPVDPGQEGQWVAQQDPLTGESIRVWVPSSTDNPDTPVDERSNDIWCMGRGITDGGIRAAATTEMFKHGDYANVDIINLWVPTKYRITKRDRVTNIRTKSGIILWRDEEYEKTGEIKATVFNVNGVVPQFDYRNNHIANFCLLERAEV